MSKARDRMVERRLSASHALAPKTKRRISVFRDGRVLTGTASLHKARSGRRFNLRLRIWRRFHTVPLILGNDDYPWSSLRR